MELQTTRDGDYVTVTVDGDLDYGSRSAFEKELQHLIRRAEVIEVDCNGLGFVDSSGVAALFDCVESAEDRDVDLRLTGVSADVRDVFEILGVTDSLPIR